MFPKAHVSNSYTHRSTSQCTLPMKLSFEDGVFTNVILSSSYNCGRNADFKGNAVFIIGGAGHAHANQQNLGAESKIRMLSHRRCRATQSPTPSVSPAVPLIIALLERAGDSNVSVRPRRVLEYSSGSSLEGYEQRHFFCSQLSPTRWRGLYVRLTSRGSQYVMTLVHLVPVEGIT